MGDLKKLAKLLKDRNNTEKEINDLTKLVLSLSATVESLKEQCNNNNCGDMEKQD